ncbi:fumarylacetoacetase [Nocardioides marmoraquaticus]
MPGATGSGFDVDHLPIAEVASLDRDDWWIGVRIGDQVLDVAAVVDHPMLRTARIHLLLAAGPRWWNELRARLTLMLTDESQRSSVEPHLVPIETVEPDLPFAVADYVDFYASEHHATNVGGLFRPDGEPLPEAWKHLPIGYHGRAGTVVASGTDVRRPVGIRGPGDVGPTQRLDLEAELGFVVGRRAEEPVGVDDLAQHVFGVVGLNDWSARDLQAFESRPLGPFLGKSFATSISCWITPLAALDAAWVPLPGQDPEPAAHLGPGRTRGLDIAVEVLVNGQVVSRPSYAAMYWSPAQMLAHLTSNGATLRTGDLLGSGTISDADEVGCLLELTRNEGPWLADGDLVEIRYTAPSTRGGHLEIGTVSGRVLPAR